MRIDDLDLRELLAFDPKGGIVRFAGQRAIILDAVAIGLLRGELIETLGVNVARGVLTRFGYSHGWRTAETMRTAIPWESEREWRIAGGRLHRLQGIVFPDPVEPSPDDRDPPFAEAIWHASYEAEQHLLHHGQADQPVCWTLCGFASGYLSCVTGERMVAIETRCMGRGDACCHLVARSQADWGPAVEPHLPYFERDSLDATLRRLTEALKETEHQLRIRAVDDEPADRPEALAAGIVARSRAMHQVVELALRVARVDVTVLITGDSGVGKERVARLIHDESTRAGGPFVAVNCAAIAQSLLESELFGHVRGAFTGADHDRVGLFEAANGGTLFLDEVGDLSRSTQVKLLRVLQEREVRRVGETKTRPIDVRIVAATNRDLGHLVEQGAFREDLFYRLGVVQINVPPLRERPEDVLPLARLFLSKAVASFGLSVEGISPEAMSLLVHYHWPGNVRELRNAVESAVILSKGTRVEPEALPDALHRPDGVRAGRGSFRTLAELERDYILAALEANDGNRERTARTLGIGVATLYRKLKRYREEDGEIAP